MSSEPGATAPTARARFLRAAGLALLVLLGVLVGATGLLVHAGWFPGGLLLALAALVGACVAGADLAGGRPGALAPGLGWALVVLPMTFWTTAEGDFLATDLTAALFLYGGVIAVVICATLLPSTRSRFGLPGDPAGRPQ
ncbi:DUF6113 family protein [Streptomyces sp. XM4193]|uniref:DUF6113 family protein n=1 Tax=Streptomyces sp. XM4193 TaxID=2929782 RepID=UPI001FF775F6|nr:DUF6113 family protein [Streptomyces sp. XM4193]MCK1796030.1 DUF6113 family protein [Streptomyces sp. XM4193]